MQIEFNDDGEISEISRGDVVGIGVVDILLFAKGKKQDEEVDLRDSRR